MIQVMMSMNKAAQAEINLIATLIRLTHILEREAEKKVQKRLKTNLRKR